MSKVKVYTVAGGSHIADHDFMIVSAADVRKYFKVAGVRSRTLVGTHYGFDDETVVVQESPAVERDRYYPKLFIDRARNSGEGMMYDWVFETYQEFRVLPHKPRGRKRKYG